MRSKLIPDLHYRVIKAHPAFTRRAHALLIYRHDKDSKPYLYHSEVFYGRDGRRTRSDAIARGKALQRGAPFFGRSTFIRTDDRRAFEATGLYIP